LTLSTVSPRTHRPKDKFSQFRVIQIPPTHRVIPVGVPVEHPGCVALG
jgi:hypothetical protein